MTTKHDDGGAASLTQETCGALLDLISRLQSELTAAKAEIARKDEALDRCIGFIESPLQMSNENDERDRQRNVIALARQARSPQPEAEGE